MLSELQRLRQERESIAELTESLKIRSEDVEKRIKDIEHIRNFTYKKYGKPFTSRFEKCTRFLNSQRKICILNIEESNWRDYERFAKKNNLDYKILRIEIATRTELVYMLWLYNIYPLGLTQEVLRNAKKVTVLVVEFKKGELRAKWIKRLFANTFCSDAIDEILSFYLCK